MRNGVSCVRGKERERRRNRDFRCGLRVLIKRATKKEDKEAEVVVEEEEKEKEEEAVS